MGHLARTQTLPLPILWGGCGNFLEPHNAEWFSCLKFVTFSHCQDWYHGSSKGSFFIDGNGNITSHQFKLHLTKDSDVFVTIQPTANKKGIFSLTNSFYSDDGGQGQPKILVLKVRSDESF